MPLSLLEHCSTGGLSLGETIGQEAFLLREPGQPGLHSQLRGHVGAESAQTKTHVSQYTLSNLIIVSK